jgi:hypothetical protein
MFPKRSNKKLIITLLILLFLFLPGILEQISLLQSRAYMKRA